MSQALPATRAEAKVVKSGGAAVTLEPWQEAWIQSHQNPWLFATGVLGFKAYDPEAAKLSAKDFAAKYGRETVMLEKWQDEFLRPEYFFTDPSGIPTGNPRHSIRAGHGVGKGVVIAILALWFPLTHYDAKCVLTANSQDQLATNNWPEVKKWAQRLPAPLRAQLQIDEERLYVKAAPEMAFVVRRTASKHNPEALQGVHAAHVMYLADEASGIFDTVFEIAQGSLSTDGAIACLFSNPTRTSGFFFDTQHKLRSTWKCKAVSCLDVPRAQGHIKEIVEGWGINSNRYRIRCLGEFPTADDETVIPLELVLAAQGRDVATSNVWPLWGADISRFGDDATALVMRQGNTVLGMKEWRNLDGAQVAGRIQALYRETPNHLKPKEIIIDVIGVGASVYDILRLPGSECAQAVRGCNVAEATAISETEDRLRDELWFRGRAWFQAKDCHIPKEFPDPKDTPLIEKFVSELTAPLYGYTSLGKRKVESKKDMKERGVASPNIADAFLLSLAGGIYPRDNPHRSRHQPQPSSTSWLGA